MYTVCCAQITSWRIEYNGVPHAAQQCAEHIPAAFANAALVDTFPDSSACREVKQSE